MNLSFGFNFEDLYSRGGIEKIHAEFLKTSPSDDLIERAKQLENFIAELFNIRAEVSELKARHNELAPLYTAKKLFVQRAAKKYIRKADGHAPAEFESDLDFAKKVLEWMDAGNEDKLISAALYAEEQIKNNSDSVLFDLPKKLDFENLVELQRTQRDGIEFLSAEHCVERDGFKLTDDGGSLEYALDQANYCIFCHNQSKDSCSKGLWEKEERKAKISPTNVPLAGCPLEEHISEMNMLKADGFPISALAAATINNPLCAATGHRICNDCMKSCIYQKQEPVDIPQLETRNLRDVLELPWGFEIYSLLTRWNPLNPERPIPREESGKKILVVGMGPAGFNLSHHLMNDGHEVVGIDGLKIEPLPEHVLTDPIENIQDIWEELDERILYGFGGVAEYGITVRWDKNFLKVIRLLLQRRSQFELLGGVRFGSNLTTEQAFEMGFDHIALCAGAGKPTVIPIRNALARGVRTASDFLMSLQLTGAAKKDSIANLQIRAPILVIGGGLTAIDTATESQAYYKLQCEKFKQRFEALCAEKSEAAVRANWNEEEAIIADEMLSYEDVKSTMVYRKRMQDSPAYRLNHEEVEKAFEEGIEMIENATPKEVVLDKFGHVEALKVEIAGEEKTIPARTVLMAAGTSPNTVLAREEPGVYELDGKYFKLLGADGEVAKPEFSAKPEQVKIFTSLEERKTISFFGDLHPDFAGNVVKAMASAKQGYPLITKVLENASVPEPQHLDQAQG